MIVVDAAGIAHTYVGDVQTIGGTAGRCACTWTSLPIDPTDVPDWTTEDAVRAHIATQSGGTYAPHERTTP